MKKRIPYICNTYIFPLLFLIYVKKNTAQTNKNIFYDAKKMKKPHLFQFIFYWRFSFETPSLWYSNSWFILFCIFLVFIPNQNIHSFLNAAHTLYPKRKITLLVHVWKNIIIYNNHFPYFFSTAIYVYNTLWTCFKNTNEKVCLI